MRYRHAHSARAQRMWEARLRRQTCPMPRRTRGHNAGWHLQVRLPRPSQIPLILTSVQKYCMVCIAWSGRRRHRCAGLPPAHLSRTLAASSVAAGALDVRLRAFSPSTTPPILAFTAERRCIHARASLISNAPIPRPVDRFYERAGGAGRLSALASRLARR